MAREKVTGFPQVITKGGLTEVHSSREFPLGALAMDTMGNLYRYVQNIAADGIDLDYGKVCYLADTSDWIVTADYTGGSSVSAKVVGVGISAITAGSYGWIQVSGIHEEVWTDGGVSAGEALIGHTADGEADTMAAGEEHLVFGWALATDFAAIGSNKAPQGQDICPAYIQCV